MIRDKSKGGGPSIPAQRVPSKTSRPRSHQRRLTNRTSQGLSGIIKFHFKSYPLMDTAQIASRPNQPVQPTTPLLENHRKGKHPAHQDLTRDITARTEDFRFLSQNSSSPQIIQEHPIAGAYIWPQNDGKDLSHSSGSSVARHFPVAPPSTSKRKREPDSPTQVLLPYPHKEWQLVPQPSSSAYGGPDKIILCSRCNIYESLVSPIENGCITLVNRSNNRVVWSSWILLCLPASVFQYMAQCLRNS